MLNEVQQFHANEFHAKDAKIFYSFGDRVKRNNKDAKALVYSIIVSRIALAIAFAEAMAIEKSYGG